MIASSNISLKNRILTLLVKPLASAALLIGSKRLLDKCFDNDSYKNEKDSIGMNLLMGVKDYILFSFNPKNIIYSLAHGIAGIAIATFVAAIGAASYPVSLSFCSTLVTLNHFDRFKNNGVEVEKQSSTAKDWGINLALAGLTTVLLKNSISHQNSLLIGMNSGVIAK